MVISTFAIALCRTNNSTTKKRNEKNKNKQSAVHAAETKTIQLNVGLFFVARLFFRLFEHENREEQKNARWKFMCRIRRYQRAAIAIVNASVFAARATMMFA